MRPQRSEKQKEASRLNGAKSKGPGHSVAPFFSASAPSALRNPAVPRKIGTISAQ